MLHRVKDLSPENRQAVEALLERALSDDEPVSIKTLGPSTIIPSALSSEERIAAFRTLNERLVSPVVDEEEFEAAFAD